jgi:serine/threonine protein kinase
LLDKSALWRTPKLSRFLCSSSDIDYLHFLDIQHHDLKCENILAVSNDCVKTVDFGFARRCRDGSGSRILSDTFNSSVTYEASVVLNEIPYNPMMSHMWSWDVSSSLCSRPPCLLMPPA